MSVGKSPKVVEIKCQRHKLPIDIILFHMVDFKVIKGLPSNEDCTELLMTASQRALDRMFVNGEAFVETFMPRRKEFEALLVEEIAQYRTGKWYPQKKTMMADHQNHNSVISF